MIEYFKKQKNLIKERDEYRQKHSDAYNANYKMNREFGDLKRSHAAALATQATAYKKLEQERQELQNKLNDTVAMITSLQTSINDLSTPLMQIQETQQNHTQLFDDVMKTCDNSYTLEQINDNVNEMKSDVVNIANEIVPDEDDDGEFA